MNTQNSYSIIIHLFVYEGDADLVMENLRCARNAVPEAKFVVIDDGNKPCPNSTRKEVEEFGAEWRVSTWDRGGNLRGRTCIDGILSELIASAENDNDVLAKIDADTCLLDGRTLRRFAASDKIIWGSGDPDVRIFGCAYALKAYAARKVRDYITTLDLYNNAPEDVIIGFSAVECFPGKENYDIATPLSKDPEHGKWAAYNWAVYPDILPFYADHTVVTVGNIPKPPLRKKHRLPVMKALRRAYEKNKSIPPQSDKKT